MAFTQDCDLFGAVSERGFNAFIEHIMRKRPSLFNYGTEWVASNWEKLLCEPPDVAPEVLDRGNPVVTVESPIPVLGTGGLYGLEFAVQLRELRIDFFPQSTALPPQLPALADQQFILTARACGGIGCPNDRVLDALSSSPLPPDGRTARGYGREGRQPAAAATEKPSRTLTLPTSGLTCCCFEVFVIGHFELTGPEGTRSLEAKLDGLEIVDLEPECLEMNLECYLRTVVQLVVLPRLRILIEVFSFEILDDTPDITLTPSNVTYNPAVEDDQVKIFVDVEVLS